jgi:hypothetical protein
VPRFTVGQEPLVLGPDSAVDLIAEQRGGRLYCGGLRVKVINDHVPLVLFPEMPFEVVRSKTKARMTFYAEPGSGPVLIAATRTEIRAGRLRASLVIPELSAETLLSVINLDFACAGDTRIPLLALRCAEGAEHPGLTGPGPPERAIVLTGGAPVAFYGTTQNQEVGVWIAPAGKTTARLTVEQVPDPGGGGAVILASHRGDLRRGRLIILIHRSSSRQLVAGRRSASFSASSLFLGLYRPLSLRMLHWVSCAMPVGETPLAVPPILPPDYPLPNLWVGDGTDMIPLVSGDAGEPRALVLFGEPPTVVVQAVASSGFFAAVIVADDNAVYLRGLQDALPGTGNRTPGTTVVSDVTVTTALVEWTPRALEEVVLDAVTDHLVPGDEETARSWRHNLAERLPPVPLVPDPRIAAVCNVVNIHRGRFPASDHQDQAWSALTQDELWLVPWTDRPGTRTDLIVGVTRRLAAEYIAITALLDLCDERPCDLRPGDNLTGEEIAFLRKQFNRARSALHETDEQRLARIEEFNSYRVRHQLSPAAIIREFAIHQYRTSEAVLRRDNLTLLNPLVIAVASESADNEEMYLAVSQWSNYAARMSGSKPASIAISLASPDTLARAQQLQAMLRKLFYGLTDRTRREVIALRRQLGGHLASALDPAVPQILTSLRPDRIVAISQLLVDYLPHEGSLLGLEIPVVRLPLSEDPANEVRLAIASAMRPGFIHRDMRACILRPDVISDKQTRWASDVAAAAAEDLRRLGLATALEPAAGTGEQELLSMISKSPIVMFFGHASASTSLAELRLGSLTLTTNDIAQADWTGSLITLVGCETAALDTDHGDLAREFINGGARAVIGTTARIAVFVADYFFEVFFGRIMQGLPLDYAFFDSRRDTAVFETLVTSQNLEPDAARARINETHARRPAGYGAFTDFLAAARTSWGEVETHAIYAMTLCMSGGTGQRILQT